MRSTIYFENSRPKRAVLGEKTLTCLQTMPGGVPSSAQHARILLHWLDVPYEQVWPESARLSLRRLSHHGRQYELLRRTYPVTKRTNWLGGRNRFLLQCARYLAEGLSRRRSVRQTWQALVWEWRWLRLQFK